MIKNIATVNEVFRSKKFGNIAGVMVQAGAFNRDDKVTLIRNGVKLSTDLKVESLRRFKDDLEKAEAGKECGIGLGSWEDVQIGDVLVQTPPVYVKVTANADGFLKGTE